MADKCINGLLGVNVTSTDSVPQFPLGTIADCADASAGTFKRYRYVACSAAKNAADLYIIASTWIVGDALTTTTDDAAPVALGVFDTAVAAPASGYTYRYAWIQTQGNFDAIGVLISCAADVELMSTATAGHADDAGGKVITGLKVTTASPASATNVPCFSNVELCLPTDA